MRDFSWNVFAMTGDVDAYLLYKHIAQVRDAVPIDVEPVQPSEHAE
ncbi:YqzL family protein [Paenibacillus arenosi]|uniref:YqzL family protein n=1 Tax=Paenibacillus arenosi TaxID=2774142 RepID=A0ABR9ARI6_9BACL|nr:YqzL family protein [Paenibacillus arenosi]MBD8496720.1 YqzL family protein [Paenibacillus arenosi]